MGEALDRSRKRYHVCLKHPFDSALCLEPFVWVGLFIFIYFYFLFFYYDNYFVVQINLTVL